MAEPKKAAPAAGSAALAHASRKGGGGADVTGFYVSCTGQVDTATMDGGDNMFVKYSFSYGPDWSYMHGLESGISQIAKRATGDGTQQYAWNYPIDIAFRSTNVFGWPRLVLSVYGITARGTDTVMGYGSVHIPTTPGRHVRRVALFAPRSSSMCQRLVAWLSGNPPEFFDSKFIAQGKGREVTRVRSTGVVTIVLNVATRNMTDLGYETSGEVRPAAEAAPAAAAASARRAGSARAGSSSSRPHTPRSPGTPRTPGSPGTPVPRERSAKTLPALRDAR